MATLALKSNTGDQKVCKKKNLSWLFGTDRKIRPSGSLFGITRLCKQWPSDGFFYLHHTTMKDSYILAYQMKFSTIFTSADKSYLTYSSDPVGQIKKKNNTCCQYIVCIRDYVILSLKDVLSWRHWRFELTSLRRQIRRQLSIWRASKYRNLTQ